RPAQHRAVDRWPAAGAGQFGDHERDRPRRESTDPSSPVPLWRQRQQALLRRQPRPQRLPFIARRGPKSAIGWGMTEQGSLPSMFAPGNVAVVTGAASGIGLAAAARFAALGLKVVLADLAGSALTLGAE